jgi:hypothetical protein
MMVRSLTAMLVLAATVALTPALLHSAPDKPGRTAESRNPSVVIFVGEG